MEVFIPLIIFWLISSVFRGLQKEQNAQRGGPLARPQARPQRDPREETAPERPVRTRQTMRQREQQQSAEPQPAPQTRMERIPRQPRLMKEGEIARPASRIWDVPAEQPEAAQQPQVQEISPIIAKKEIESPQASQLASIRNSLKQPQSLQAAILYSEILGAPRSRRPHRTPLQNQ